jgi:hypothetical protein
LSQKGFAKRRELFGGCQIVLVTSGEKKGKCSGAAGNAVVAFRWRKSLIRKYSGTHPKLF